MEKDSVSQLYQVIIAAVLCVAWRGIALCAPSRPEMPYETRIEGVDHRTLKDYFSRFERNEANGVPGEAVQRALLRALPDAYETGCEEIASQSRDNSNGPINTLVKVLFVEAREEKRPIRAVIVFIFSSKTGEFSNRIHELPAALVIDGDSSRLSIMQQDPDQGECREFARIGVERKVHISGRDVIGLNFVRSKENASIGESTPVLREERIDFYVFDDNGIKPAGSVLKAREELQSGDAGEVKSVYSATVVFRKDMKGNVVGILSPYTIMRNDGRMGKGMVR